MALEQATALFPAMVEVRRHLHAHPELSYQEFETAALVARTLGRLDGVTEIRSAVGRTGVTAVIQGQAGPGPCIALRADMDALPIQEANLELPYASKTANVMHACGHDAHVAVLLATAEILAASRASLHGSIKLLFQPAEEGGAGAVAMIQDGALEGVDEVYGLHMWNTEPAGKVAVSSGPVMANSDRFTIQIVGRGGHGSMPHLSVDAVVAASHLVTALQTIASRNIDPQEPVVLTVGKVTGGYGANIIADKVELIGTVRCYSIAVQSQVMARMQEVVDGIAMVFGLQAKLQYFKGYPAVVNPVVPSRAVRVAAETVVGAANVMPARPSLAGEDFAFFLLQRPGCFFFVGSSPQGAAPGSVPHHIPTFDLDEAAMPVGAAVFVQLIRDRLGAPTAGADSGADTALLVDSLQSLLVRGEAVLAAPAFSLVLPSGVEVSSAAALEALPGLAASSVTELAIVSSCDALLVVSFLLTTTAGASRHRCTGVLCRQSQTWTRVHVSLPAS